MKIKLLIIISLLVLVPTLPVYADSITFTHQTDQDGRHTISNMPKFCVLNGVLVCHLNSSLFKDSRMSYSLQPRAESKKSSP
jgi:L-asparagine transporter-like permease